MNTYMVYTKGGREEVEIKADTAGKAKSLYVKACREAGIGVKFIKLRARKLNG